MISVGSLQTYTSYPVNPTPSRCKKSSANYYGYTHQGFTGYGKDCDAAFKDWQRLSAKKGNYVAGTKGPVVKAPGGGTSVNSVKLAQSGNKASAGTGNYPSASGGLSATS